ncbi:hypothetical protein HDV57DRAFT_133629 [Trichoderma longibrachiatum]
MPSNLGHLILRGLVKEIGIESLASRPRSVPPDSSGHHTYYHGRAFQRNKRTEKSTARPDKPATQHPAASPCPPSHRSKQQKAHPTAPAPPNLLAACSVMRSNIHQHLLPLTDRWLATNPKERVVHACICTYKNTHTRQLSTCSTSAHKHTYLHTVKRTLSIPCFETACERSHKDTLSFVHIDMFGLRLDDLPLRMSRPLTVVTSPSDPAQLRLDAVTVPWQDKAEDGALPLHDETHR